MFPELEAAGCLVVPAGALQVGEAIGTTLRHTVEGLTALTPELVVREEAATAVEEAGASCSRQGAWVSRVSFSSCRARRWRQINQRR